MCAQAAHISIDFELADSLLVSLGEPVATSGQNTDIFRNATRSASISSRSVPGCVGRCIPQTNVMFYHQAKT
jgi:hypothetical protein